MVVEPQEAAQFSALADGLLINVGTLNALRAESMRAAVAAANQAGKPWTLDPVAVGALSYRTAFAKQLLDEKPAAIRGNASEIMALSGLLASGRGLTAATIRWRPCPPRVSWHSAAARWWRSPARWITSPTANAIGRSKAVPR